MFILSRLTGQEQRQFIRRGETPPDDAHLATFAASERARRTKPAQGMQIGAPSTDGVEQHALAMGRELGLKLFGCRWPSTKERNDPVLQRAGMYGRRTGGFLRRRAVGAGAPAGLMGVPDTALPFGGLRTIVPVFSRQANTIRKPVEPRLGGFFM
ncbi:MAG: hypothetical protein V4597_18395 [Pseudomonadota bacterium]